jgi:Alpha/beta hydrolase domain containing 18
LVEKRSAGTETVGDYCVLNGDPGSRLSDFERLTLVGGPVIDRLLERLTRQTAQMNLRPLLGEASLGDVQAAVDAARSVNLAQCTALPREPVPTRVEVPLHGVPDGTIYDLAFPGSFMPTVRDQLPERYAVRDLVAETVHARLWEHSNPGAHPTIIAVHGWNMGEQRVSSLVFVPGLLFAQGFNVCLLELPHHGRRALPGLERSFPSIDLLFTNLAISQAVSDLRQLRSVLEQRGHQTIGALGVSLGAYISLSWSVVEKLDFGIFLVPLVSIGDVAWRLLKERFTEPELIGAGLSKLVLREVFSAHSPVRSPPLTDLSRLLVVAGRGDQVVPREQIEALRRGWPGVGVRWLQGGHGAPFRKGEAVSMITEFLKRQFRAQVER